MKKTWLFSIALLAWLAQGFPALADSRVDAMSSDPRITDDLDIIWAYPNKILEYKDQIDFRLNSSGGYGNFGNGVGEWGGFSKDLSEFGLSGVLAVYLNRPFVPGTGVYPTEYWIPTGGTGFWQATDNNLYQAPDRPVSGVAVINSGSQAVTLGPLTPNNKIDLFWADSFAGFGDLGLRLSYGDNQPNSDSNSVTSTADNSTGASNADTSQAWSVELGAGFSSAFFNKINFHAGFSSGSFSDKQIVSNSGITTVNNSSTSNGITTLEAGTLLKHNFNANDDLHVFGDWFSSQFAGTDTLQESSDGDFTTPGATNYQASNKYTLMVATLGFSGNHKFDGGKSLITSGFMANYWDSKQTASEADQPSTVSGSSNYSAENDITILSLNWNLGVEAQVADWLTLRAGLEKFIYDRTTTQLTTSNPSNPTTTVTTTGDASNPFGGVSFSTGFGVNIEKWNLNVVASAGSLEQTLVNLQPGNGLLFDDKQGTGNGPIVTLIEADLTHPL
ncbi:MAG: hypothetical protein ACREL1_09270 [bacterium]